jgi:hypothetical protein
MRSTCEAVNSIDMRRWAREGRLRPDSSFYWQWTRTGQRTGIIHVHVGTEGLVLDYRVRSAGETEWRPIRQQLWLAWSDCHLGGRRLWVRCGCGRRCAKLYGAGHLFTCRSCARLGYESQLEAPRWRLLSKAQKIRMRLGGDANIQMAFPAKPPRMRWSTYERLRHRSEAAVAGSLGMTLTWLRRRYPGLEHGEIA